MIIKNGHRFRSGKATKTLALSLLATISLAGCKSPVDITYPPIVSASNGDTVIVRGTTVDPEKTTAISVNGTNASSANGWENWEVTVPLAMGINKLTVETVDTSGKINSSAASVQIERVDTFLVDAANGTLDSANNRMLLVDDDLDAIVAVDLTTGDQSILSSAGVPDNINLLYRPISITLDSINNRALVLDQQNYAVIAVDLSTGARTVLSNASIPDGTNRLITPVDIVIDTTRNSALVADAGADAVVAVDLTTGQRTILSDSSTPNADNPFGRIDSIALDTSRNRALVVDLQNQNIVAVNLVTGERSQFSDFNGSTSETSFSYPQGISIDTANDRALIIDHNQKVVIAMDLNTGEHSLVSAAGSADVLIYARDIILDPNNNRALIPDTIVDAVVAMDLGTGQNQIISHSLLGFDHTLGAFFGGVALDKDNNRLLVADDTSNAIIAVDRKNGKRSILSDNTNLSATNEKYLAVVSSITIDEANQRALVLERSTTRTSVQTINLKTGERTILSNNSTPNTDNPLKNLEDIAIDSANNRALLVASDQPAIYEVNLATGARTVLSDNNTPNANIPFGNIINAITVDATNNRAFITDETNDAILAVDLTSGERSLFWEFATPTVYEKPAGITLDRNNNRLLLTIPGLDALIAIDLTSKAQTFVSDSNTPDARNMLDIPGKIALDSESNQAYVMDNELGLIAIDLKTGRRVVMSR